MSDGIEIQSLPEDPQESREAAEAKGQLDRAALEPEAALEKGDIKQAEAVQEAFIAVVPPVQALETPPAAQESAPETGQDSGGKAGFGSENSTPAENYSGVNLAQGEVLEDNDWNDGGAGPSTDQADPGPPPAEGDLSDLGGPAPSQPTDAAYTPTFKQNQQTAANDIAGQTELVKGAVDSLKKANEATEELQEILDELSQEEGNPEQPDSNSAQRDLPAAQQKDAQEMGRYFEQENKPLESQAQAMDTPAGTVGEDDTGGIQQDQKAETLWRSTDSSPESTPHLTQRVEIPQESEIVANNNPTLSGSGAPSASGLPTDDMVKEMEEKLNETGDDAELADIDLQSALEKQQEMIDKLSKLGELQRETAETMVRKMALGQTSAGDTTETGEGGENKIVIPAGNSQIDFASIAGEIQKVDSFSWKLSVAKDEVGDFRVPTLHLAQIEPLPDRNASGDYLETPAAAADLNLTEKQDPPAFDPDLKPEQAGESQSESRDQQAAIREEISVLQDELSDWPDDGSNREITYTEWVQNEDGTYVRAETTLTLTKDECEYLLDKLKSRVDEADSRSSSEGFESPYQLVEGSILVEGAISAEKGIYDTDFLEGLEIEREEEGDGSNHSPEELDEINEKINNHLETINSIYEQINLLEDLQQDLAGSQITISVVLLFAEKQSDGTYTMVPKQTPVSEYTIPQIIDNMRFTVEKIGWEVRNIGNGGDDPDILDMLQKFETSLQNILAGKLDELE